MKFIGYAKEHFDGTPADYDVCFYDDCEEPQLDVEDPNISLDIHIEGNLSDPMQKSQLIDFCRQHRIPLTLPEDECLSKSCTEDSVLEAFESSATEAPHPIAAIKNFITKKRIALSTKHLKDVEPQFKANEQKVEKAIQLKQPIATLLSPEQAARYYIAYVQSQATVADVNLYILIENDVKAGRSRSAEVVSAGCAPFLEQLASSNLLLDTGEASNEQQKEREKILNAATTTILASIKKESSGNGKTIAGYTLDKELANRFKNSLSDAAGFDKQTPEKLEEVWAKASTSQRMQIIRKVLGVNTNLIEQSVQNIIVSHENPFTGMDMKIVNYAVQNKQKLNPNVFAALSKSRALQKCIKYGRFMKGLNLSNETQLATISVAVRCDAANITFKDIPEGRTCVDYLKDGENGWKTEEEMEVILPKLKQLYAQTQRGDVKAEHVKDDTRDRSSKGSRTAGVPRGSSLPENVWNILRGYSADQKRMIKAMKVSDIQTVFGLTTAQVTEFLAELNK